MLKRRVFPIHYKSGFMVCRVYVAFDFVTETPLFKNVIRPVHFTSDFVQEATK